MKKKLTLRDLYLHVMEFHKEQFDNNPTIIESALVCESLEVIDKLRARLADDLEEEDLWKECVIEYPAEFIIDELDSIVAHDAGCIDCLIEWYREELHQEGKR